MHQLPSAGIEKGNHIWATCLKIPRWESRREVNLEFRAPEGPGGNHEGETNFDLHVPTALGRNREGKPHLTYMPQTASVGITDGSKLRAPCPKRSRRE